MDKPWHKQGFKICEWVNGLIGEEVLIVSSMAVILDQFCSPIATGSRYIQAFTAMSRLDFLVSIVMKIDQFKLLIVTTMAIPLNYLGPVIYTIATDIQAFAAMNSNNIIKTAANAS